MKAFKVFYVEADSVDGALASEAVECEEHTGARGDFDWEHDETDAKEVDPSETVFIRNRHPELITQ